MNSLRIDVDDEGIALISIQVLQRSMNVLTADLVRDLSDAIEQIASTPSIKGAIFTSGKTNGFLVGADLTDLVNTYDSHITPSQGMKVSQRISLLYRQLETCGKPIAAAINGLALGGGLELCLACHYRVINDDPKTFVGLPEVKVGLLPGAGGTQRLSRLVGIPAALPWLMTGNNISPAEALAAGLVQAVVPTADLIDNARSWLLTHGQPVQPWDRKGFSVPNGAGPLAGHAMQSFVSGTALVTGTAGSHYPAPLAILSSVFEGTQVAIDVGLRIESKYFGKLLADPVARNLMRTLFIGKGIADKLPSRPRGIKKFKAAKIGVVGVGSTSAAIASMNARAGMNVVLLDTTQESAAKAKADIAAKVTIDVAKRSMSQETADACLNRIEPTNRYADLSSADLIIESALEDKRVKADVIERVEEVVTDTLLLGITSHVLEISGLTKGAKHPARFIGLHFFPPVAKTPLVEIIKGPQTSDASLARALDYVAQLRKTPIIVGDFPGFFVSRLFSTFLQEGEKMLEDGIAPALVENAAKATGFPMGPLALADDFTISLQQSILKQQDLDEVPHRFKISIGRAVIDRMVDDIKRPGRGSGFYEYAGGVPYKLWSGLSDAFPQKRSQPDSNELRLRFLSIMALESAHCMEDGVIRNAVDADLGSVLGVGYPSWTGGTLSYIDTVGAPQFMRDCRSLADRWGSRFEPSEWLIEREKSDSTFYPNPTAVVCTEAG